MRIKNNQAKSKVKYVSGTIGQRRDLVQLNKIVVWGWMSDKPLRIRNVKNYCSLKSSTVDGINSHLQGEDTLNSEPYITHKKT